MGDADIVLRHKDCTLRFGVLDNGAVWCEVNSVEQLDCVVEKARQCCKEVVRYGGESSFKGWRFFGFICSLEGVVLKMTR